MRARVVTNGIGGGIQLQLGDGCEALLVGNGAFVYRNGQPAGMSPAAKVPVTGEADLMLVRRGTRMEIWVDGIRLAEGVVDGEASVIGIGLHSGSARFENVRVRELR